MSKTNGPRPARLFELLPKQPNDLWQMDVTYIHIPGHRWWYAVTMIDYYSHSPTCAAVRKMLERHRVEFRSVAEAEKAGFRQAGDCHPR